MVYLGPEVFSVIYVRHRRDQVASLVGHVMPHVSICFSAVRPVVSG